MSLDRPRILYITSFRPDGPVSGAQLRVLNIGRQLKRVGDVSLLVVDSEVDKTSHESRDGNHFDFSVKYAIRTNDDAVTNWKDRIRYELDPTFINTHYNSISETDRDLVMKMAADHDLVWIHSIRTANVLRVYQWPCAVLDVDDIQSRLYMSYAKHGVGIIRRALDRRLAFLWWRREQRFQDRFSVLTVCSEEDRRYFINAPRVHVVPNGFERPSRTPDYCFPTDIRLGFVGPMHFAPNRKGIEWFTKNVWPSIKCQFPDARLRLVGAGTDDQIPALGPDIDGLGFVRDPSDEIASWSAFIVPIGIGGGTRVKIAEAFSRKCPVVSTSMGAFGYRVENGKELLLADSAREFAEACIRLVTDRGLARQITENAWLKFLFEHTWDAIGDSVERAIDACVCRG